MKTLIPFKKVLLVLNPISGDISKDEVQGLLETFCQEQEIYYQYFYTTGHEDDKKLARVLQKFGPDLVVAIGGDGTVSLAANQLNHKPVPLAIIPMGSGNGLSKDLGIPQDLEAALLLIQEGSIRPIDSLDINGHTVFHLADLGFNARIVKLFCEGDTRGPGAYARLALQEYMRYEPFSYRIQTDGESFSGPAFMLTIANANAFGSNAAINPDGVVDDGFFEICLLEPFPKAAALGILYNLYTDNIQRSVYSRFIKCREATIIKTKEDILQVDGEPVEVGNTLRVKLFRKSLRVVVPPDSLED